MTPDPDDIDAGSGLSRSFVANLFASDDEVEQRPATPAPRQQLTVPREGSNPPPKDPNVGMRQFVAQLFDAPDRDHL